MHSTPYSMSMPSYEAPEIQAQEPCSSQAVREELKKPKNLGCPQVVANKIDTDNKTVKSFKMNVGTYLFLHIKKP